MAQKAKILNMRCEATGEDVKISKADLKDIHDSRFRVFMKGKGEAHLKSEEKRGCRIIHRDAIFVSPQKNVRRFDTEKASFTELLDAIKAHGIVTPLMVRRSEKHYPCGYELVAGFRRFEAATRAELDHVPCSLAGKDDNPQVVGLLENLGREDMNPMEKAAMIAKLQVLGGEKDEKTGKVKKLSQRQLAAKLGMSQASVSDALALTKDVHSSVANAVADGTLPPSKAAIIKQLPPKHQKKQLEHAEDLDIRELRKHIGKVRADLGIKPPAHGPSKKSRILKKAGRKFEFAPITDIVDEMKRLEDLVFGGGKVKKSDRRALQCFQWVLKVVEDPCSDPVKWTPPQRKTPSKKGVGKTTPAKKSKKGTKKAKK